MTIVVRMCQNTYHPPLNCFCVTANDVKESSLKNLMMFILQVLFWRSDSLESLAVSVVALAEQGGVRG